MIKAVIFDLGGVLFTNGTKKFIENISARFDLDIELVREVMDGELGTQYRESKITRDEFWKKAREALNIKEDIDKLENEWISGYELIEGTRDIVLALARKYKVYYLSDNVRDRVEKINKIYKFMGWFEGGVFSHEVGVRKPNPKIYKLVLEKANVLPEEAIFIDDKPHFLEPARQLGMMTFLFESPDKLRTDLSQRQIL